MGSKFTRHQFLTAVSAGTAYLASTNLVGCALRERTQKVKPLQGPKVMSLPGDSSASANGVWAFRSRPDLSPPVVGVTTQAHDTASGYTFVAPEKGGAGQGGSMIVDDRGQVVWFRPLQKGTYGRTHDFKVQS